NIVFGDNGVIDYVIADGDSSTLAPGADIDLIQSLSYVVGGNDTITTGSGDDIIVGGAGQDMIAAGDGQNFVFGDNGLMLSANAVNNAADRVTPLTRQPMTFGQVGTITPTIGDNDTITTGVGRDVIFGGFGNDLITANGGETLTNPANPDGNNIVFGDHG